ncbi:MAG: hypothetical protein DUD39_03965 [Coriobacteriaceae bacterium]|nr:MAG: hypothetical protein DUD39_03965 [Coriobacteriaceae bacterium]
MTHRAFGQRRLASVSIHLAPSAVMTSTSSPLLSGELVEKQVQHVLAVPLVGVKSEFVCKFANAPRLLFRLHEPALIARDGDERERPLLELLDRRVVAGLPPRPLPAL